MAQLKARVIATAPEEPCAVWPCNTGTVALFEGMLTQWRTDGAGFCGLDYGVLPGVAQSRGIAPQRAWQLLPQLQIMEDEALQVFAERRERYIAESRQ